MKAVANHKNLYIHPSGSYYVILTMPKGSTPAQFKRLVGDDLAVADDVAEEMRRILKGTAISVPKSHEDAKRVYADTPVCLELWEALYVKLVLDTVRGYYTNVWLPRIRKAKKNTSVTTYRSAFHKWILPNIGDVRLTDLTSPDVVRMLNVIREDCSWQTTRGILIPLRSMLRSACAEGLMPQGNVAREVTVPEKTSAEKSKPKPRALTHEESERVVAAINPIRRLLLLTMFGTGVRIGEALAWRWRDLDGCRLTVRQRYSAGKFDIPKNGKVRTILISPELAGELVEWQLQTRHPGSDDLIFCQMSGRPLDANHLYATLWAAYEEAGIKFLPEQDQGFHVTRHSWCTWMIEHHGWGELPRIAAQAGNTPPILASTYHHLRPDDLLSPLPTPTTLEVAA